MLLFVLLTACSSRPVVGSMSEDTSSPGGDLDSAADMVVESFTPPYMIRGLFGPMFLEPAEHDFDDPAEIRAMGFDTVGLAQYLLLSPAGIQMEMWSHDEIREIVSMYTDAGLGVSLTLSMGYTPTGSKDDWIWATNIPAQGVDPTPLMETLGAYMVDLIPLARELGIYQLSVNEADLFLHETHSDATPDFSKVSSWGQELRSDMEAEGWGLSDDEQLIWKTGYGFVPFDSGSTPVGVDLDFSGYTGAGFSITPSDDAWIEDPEEFGAQYRDMVERSLEHFADAIPEGETWPSITEMGAWGCGCGFWNVEDASECERYWSEAHIQEVYSAVMDAVAAWNQREELTYRGVFVMDSPTDSGQFGLSDSGAVQETIRVGLEGLD